MYEELKARLLAWTKTSSSFGLDSIGKDIEKSLEAIEELERHRYLAVSAIENLVKQKGRHNTEIAYKKLVDVLAAIKESEV